MLKYILAISILFCVFSVKAQHPKMYYADTTATGVPFSKDPSVIKFKGKYLMYYSIKSPKTGNGMDGWKIGISESNDLYHWKKIGEVNPEAAYESKGLCAPCAKVINGKVHIFYQTYGNFEKDAICHAFSDNGLNFTRNATNPIFHPTGSWTNGRAIDADVYQFNNQYFLYFATRDAAGKIQKQGVAVAPGNTNFDRNDWKQAVDSAILSPKYAWEGECIEAASVIQKGKYLYMFYAGSYNNVPQQIGVAKSTDGISWQRLSDKPFLANGKPGEWNASESGHPGIFEDSNGKTYLFYQGNNDKGRTWLLSNRKIGWKSSGPYLLKD